MHILAAVVPSTRARFRCGACGDSFPHRRAAQQHLHASQRCQGTSIIYIRAAEQNSTSEPAGSSAINNTDSNEMNLAAVKSHIGPASGYSQHSAGEPGYAENRRCVTQESALNRAALVGSVPEALGGGGGGGGITGTVSDETIVTTQTAVNHIAVVQSIGCSSLESGSCVRHSSHAYNCPGVGSGDGPPPTNGCTTACRDTQHHAENIKSLSELVVVVSSSTAVSEGESIHKQGGGVQDRDVDAVERSEEGVVCGVCGLCFATSREEEEHWEWLSPKEERWNCEGCSRVFVDERALRQHAASCKNVVRAC